MIEKTKEKDILVSYDKTLRDKKTEKTLSIDGMSISSAWGEIKYADVVNGYMYYLLYSDSGMLMCKANLDNSSEPEIVKKYNAPFSGGTDFIVTDLASLNAIDNKIYINRRMSISLEAEEYIVECLDTDTGNIDCFIDITSDDELSEKAESKYWVTSELFYDKDDNMYFAGVDSSAWCLYRMNLKTQEISEVFKLDNSTKMIADVDILGGDRRYLLVTTTDTDIQQFKASSGLMDKYEKMVKELGNKPKIIKVCLSAVLDKADIGTGNKEWIQITPE